MPSSAVIGEADHAGPTPMHMRKDALAAASEMISTIEDIAIKNDVTATVGRLDVHPDVVNCVPGKVTFSLDIRHMDDELRMNTLHKMIDKMQEVASERGVAMETKNLWDAKTTIFHEKLVDLILETADDYKYTSKRMSSGAGHDAKYMNELGPTAMIFLPSVNGKSHDVSELTLDEDIEKGANVLFGVVKKLANWEKLQ